MVLSKCVVCDSKKSKFIKEQEASGLLSILGIKIPLIKTPLVGLKSIKQVNKRCNGKQVFISGRYIYA